MNAFNLQGFSDHTFNPLKAAVPRKIPDQDINPSSQPKDRFFQEFQRPASVKLTGQNVQQPKKMTTITVSDLNNLRALKKNMQRDSSGIDAGFYQPPGINKNPYPNHAASASVTNVFPGIGNAQNYKKITIQEINNNPSTQIDNVIKSSNQFTKKNMVAMQMRQRFQGLLGKLIELETREIAVNQLREMILQYQTEEHLRLWISALSEYHARHQFYASWEQEVLLIGFIASIYKEKLLDPADKPPSLVKTTFKLCEMIQKYFQSKQCGEAISQACGESWVRIYECCLKNQSTANKSLVLYTTLKNILTGGGDRQAQLTALTVLEVLLEKLKVDGDVEFVQNIAKTFFTNIYVRNGIETFSTFRGCQNIVETLHIKNLIAYTSLIVEKALAVLNDKKSTNYKVKIGACGLLEILGVQFQSMTENLVGSYHDEVLSTLGECCRDRVLLVQAAAKQALLQWTKFQKQFEELEQFKLHKQRKSNRFDIDVDSLIQDRTSQKSTNKSEQFYKPKNSRGFLSAEEYEENRLPTKNSTQNQPKEFVKKKSGTGGGSVAVNSEDVRIRPASKYREMSQLKNHIMRLREEQQQQGQMMDSNSEILNDTVKMEDSLEDQENNDNSYDHSRVSDGLEDTIRVRGVSFNDEPPEVDQLAETMDFNSSKGRFPAKGILRSAENKEIAMKDSSKAMKNFKNSGNQQTLPTGIPQEMELREIWTYSIELADQGNFQEAFQTILDSGDDLYLIRLMLRNKQGFKTLSDTMKTQITMKLLQQMERQYLMRLCMGFLGQGTEDKEILKELSAVECNEIVQVLEIAKGSSAMGKKSDLSTKADRLQGFYQRQLDQLQQQQDYDYE